VISADISPAMLDVARRRAAELGLANVDLRVIDAERIDLPDASVDGVICRFGYMIMADPGVALAETRRVLRPGGRRALAVWGAPERNPFFAAIAMALVGGGHMPPPPPEGPGIFSMASEGRTRGLLEGAGFREVRLEEVPVRCAFGGVDEYLELIADTAGPIGLVLAGLGDEERRAVAAQVADVFAPFATAEGYEVPGVTLGAVAR
jgi:SAM-dependent methyltransferase